MIIFRYLPALVPAFLAMSPAHAAGGIPLPEPSGLVLLGLGVAGVIIGRKLSSRPGGD